jgi:hypothetical protein
MIRLVMVVLPEPVPPQIPMISGRVSSGRIARAPRAGWFRPAQLVYFFFRFFSSITACAAARRAIGTQNGVALT